MRALGCIVSCLCCLAGAMGSASAQQSSAQQRSDKAGAARTAEKLYDAAVEAYSNDDFDTATKLFRLAYDKTPDAVLLYNLALSEWKSGHPDKGRIAMGQALKDGLGASLEPKARSRLRALEVVVQASEQASSVAQARAAAAASNKAASDATIHPTKALAADQDAMGGLFWAGTAASVLGAGALAAGLVLDHQIGERARQLETNTSLAFADQQRRYDQIQTRQHIGIPLLVGGTVSLVSGLTMVALSLRSTAEDSPPSQQVDVHLNWSKDAAAVTLGGAFDGL